MSSALANVIRLLPDAIANQIAAGEVVQRPASVVKELLENAIDAGATDLQLIIKDAGRTLIQVIDNGSGMSTTDARMSFERHATSKIREADDLFKIKTMGFRGEALASIAAVAQVEMKTKRDEDSLGQHIVIDGSDFKKQEPIQCPVGTQILVKNLFFNVPARRNFLKKDAVEFSYILAEFKHVALAHPQIKFSLFHNDVEVYLLGQTTLAKRIVDVFGKSYKEQLAECKENTTHLNISGYIGKPSSAKKARGDQYLFVNQRFVKNNYVHHAILRAFEETIPQGYHPFYVLFLDIDPKHIDINIHPTKTEIKFDDERTVYGLVNASVKKAIGVYNLTPSIDFESTINPETILFRPQISYQAAESNLKKWDTLFTKPSSVNNISQTSYAHGGFSETIFESKANAASETEKMGSGFIQLGTDLVVSRLGQDLVIIDQRAAFERIYFEKYLKTLKNKVGLSQTLLFPFSLELMPHQNEIFLENEEVFYSLGFRFEKIDQMLWSITGVPIDFPQEGSDAILELIEAHDPTDHGQWICKSMAKRQAAKNVKVLLEAEMKQMFEQLMATESPGISPAGTHTLKRFSTSQLFDILQK